MLNFVNFVVTNAKNSKEQYRCTSSRVSNYLKISTVVDSLLYPEIILTENRYLSWTIFSLAPLIQFEGKK